MYTNTKIVYTSLLLLALVAIATPARLRADQQEFLEVGVCDQESCTGNRHCSEGGKCVCKDGFTGKQCERETCKCNPLGGSCDASGKCVCEQGFKGELCYDFDCPSNCSSTAAGTRATGCEVSKTGNLCVCRDGFTGPRCEASMCGATDFGVPCNGRGKCDETKNSCQCTKGWMGSFCNTLVGCGECVNGQCSNGTCVCNKGYRGPKCDKRICEGKDGIACSGQGQCNRKDGLDV